MTGLGAFFVEKVVMAKVSKLRRKPYKQVVRAEYPKIFRLIPDEVDAKKYDPGEVRACFKSLCENIHTKLNEQIERLQEPWSGRGSGRPSREITDIHNNLRFDVYILVREVKRLEWWGHVKEMVDRKTPGRRAKNLTARRYIEVLYYLINDPEPGTNLSELLSSDAIADMANQLAYAHKHDVPFPFLLGFLTHVGFDEAARKAREGTYEDWHPSATKQASKPVKEPVARQKARRSDT